MSGDDDRDLERLFEQTAAEPSSFELTRMSARARELPTRLERVPRTLPRWSWAPAFAALAALAALGVTLGQALSPGRSSSSTVAGATAAPLVAPATASEPSVVPPAASTKAPLGDRSDEANDLDGFSLGSESDDDPFDFSPSEEKELSR
ncbi:MAG TPA: hypothetical protein VF103_02510 [Polyangiaceae bacterium]